MVTVGFILSMYEEGHIVSGPKKTSLQEITDQKRIIGILSNLRGFFGKRKVDSLVPNDVGLYFKHRKIADSTLRREIGALNAAINFVETNFTEYKGIGAFKLPLPPAPAGTERFLFDDEIERLMVESRFTQIGHSNQGFIFGYTEEPTRLHTFCAIGLYTGARRSSIEELKWSQVDFIDRIIDFRVLEKKQTRKRRVPVPISDKLLPILEAAKEASDSRYVLDHGGSVYRGFKSACRRAEIHDCHPHTLRHTFITRALKAGKKPYDVAALVGDTVETILKRYGHHHPDYLRDAVNF